MDTCMKWFNDHEQVFFSLDALVQRKTNICPEDMSKIAAIETFGTL